LCETLSSVTNSHKSSTRLMASLNKTGSFTTFSASCICSFIFLINDSFVTNKFSPIIVINKIYFNMIVSILNYKLLRHKKHAKSLACFKFIFELKLHQQSLDESSQMVLKFDLLPLQIIFCLVKVNYGLIHQFRLLLLQFLLLHRNQYVD